MRERESLTHERGPVSFDMNNGDNRRNIQIELETYF